MEKFSGYNDLILKEMVETFHVQCPIEAETEAYIEDAIRDGITMTEVSDDEVFIDWDVERVSEKKRRLLINEGLAREDGQEVHEGNEALDDVEDYVSIEYFAKRKMEESREK